MIKEDPPSWTDWLLHKIVAATTLLIIIFDHWGATYGESTSISRWTVLRCFQTIFVILFATSFPGVTLIVYLFFFAYVALHLREILDWVRERRLQEEE